MLDCNMHIQDECLGAAKHAGKWESIIPCGCMNIRATGCWEVAIDLLTALLATPKMVTLDVLHNHIPNYHEGGQGDWKPQHAQNTDALEMIRLTAQGKQDNKRKRNGIRASQRATYGMPPKLKYTTEADAEVKRIMVVLVAAATSGSTPISNIKGPCITAHDTMSSLIWFL